MIFLSTGHYFSRCDHFNSFIRWSLLSENEPFQILHNAEASSIANLKQNAGYLGENGNPCAWISLNASTAGRATVVATFSFDLDSDFEAFTEPILLKATSKVAAYYPLVVLQGGNGNQFGGYWFDLSGIHSRTQTMDSNSLKELYLVPGSTMDVFLFGGPERWDQGVEFIETVDVIGESKHQITGSTAVQKLSSGLYQVSCRSKVSYVSTWDGCLHFHSPPPLLLSVLIQCLIYEI